MVETKIIIVGTGPEGRIAADIFLAMGTDVLGFLETSEEQKALELNDINVFARFGSKDAQKVLADQDLQYIVTLGDIAERRSVYETAAKSTKRPASNGVHPLAWVSQNAKIGFGNLVNAHAAINANAEIGDMNHLHTGASIEPDAKVGNYCTLSPGVRVGAKCEIADEVFIGTGAVIYPGVKIGKGAIIGAGSVVLREVKKGQTVHGNPAKEI
jgi:sugar O-acyltransferase (sialic acid O-acetyltransferase NeuD family)